MKKPYLIPILLLLISVSLIAAFSPKTKKATTPRPNILFILADDWSYPFAGVYGDKTVHTPNLDKLAKRGVTFTQAYCASPSCTPSRAAILTGKYPHNLGEGVNLVGKLDTAEATYVKELRKNGYAVSFDRKGWGPGKWEKMGYTENPAGKQQDFNKFIDSIGSNQPFCFWWGTNDPHRPYDIGGGTKSGIDSTKIKLPKFLPDHPSVRGDIGDYFAEIERLDREMGDLFKKLEEKRLLDNTMIVVTGDNGMPFPHAKANLYDYGTRVPLVISFPKLFKQNIRSETFVNLIDLMPTFMEVAQVPNQYQVDGISLVPILRGDKTVHRNEVFLEREKHCICRKSDLGYPGYPMRAVRTKAFLYIQNLRPDRMPAGDATIEGTPSEYGDVDGGPTKAYMIENSNDFKVRPYFKMGFEKRVAEELYDVNADPYNIKNLAQSPQYTLIKKSLKSKLSKWMHDTNDPRRDGGGDEIDTYPTLDKAWITKWSIIFWDK